MAFATPARIVQHLADVKILVTERVGGVAAWLLFAYCLATMIQLFVLGGQPATASEAFDLLHRSRLVGLLRLDLPTVLALPLYYLVFLGLFAALRHEDPAGATLATALASLVRGLIRTHDGEV